MRRCLAVLAVLCALPIAAACVGDDPVTSATAPDPRPDAEAGAPNDGASPVDAATDAARDLVVQVSAGARTSCALYQSGKVYCWGDNAFGELGIGAAGADHVPPTKLPFTRPVIRMSVGTYTGCAVEDDNSLWCWGDNQFGDIGEPIDAAPGCGARRCEIAPVLVPGVKVKDVALGFHFGCAVAVDGHLYCWGINNFSQAAADSAVNPLEPPTLVPNLVNVTKMAFGYGGHTACVLDKAGAVWCWGANTLGALGHAPGAGTPADGVVFASSYINKTPQKVVFPGALEAVDLVAGETVCAAMDDGSVYCWGSNMGNELQLAGPDSSPHPVPTKIGSLSGIIAITGATAFCALAGSNAPFCWGPSPLAAGAPSGGTGCVTPGGTAASCHDVRPVGNLPLVAVSANDLHAVGLSKEGLVLSWGDDLYGRVNAGDAGGDSGTFVATPAPVRGLP